jgi:carbonic anhydrase
MSTPSGDDTAAAAAGPARRLSPKLMLVAGASLLLVTVLGAGLAWWAWPKGPDPSEAKAARLAARRAAAQAAAASAASAAAAAHATLPASAAAGDAPVAAEAASPHGPDALQATDHAARPDEVPPAPTVAAAETGAHAPHPAKTAAELPLDRLQRRLGDVLGARGAVQTGQHGELRVLARDTPAVPVRHAEGPAADKPAAAESAKTAHAPHDAAAGHAVHWSYSGAGGPQAWGRLKPEFGKCATGQRQSPIDIRDGIPLELEPVQFDYKPSSFAVVDNGHTVQVNVAPGNEIEVNGRRYALLQFHFHRPSEERIDGRQYEMDAHLVHKDAEGRLAVVAVLLERGAAQPLLQTVWNNLPLEKNEEVAARAQIDLNQLLPADRRYYTYMGSLTTPPCSEGVLWMVMQQPVPVSAQQIDIFARLYPMNARPLQQAAGRLIKQSN